MRIKRIALVLAAFLLILIFVTAAIGCDTPPETEVPRTELEQMFDTAVAGGYAGTYEDWISKRGFEKAYDAAIENGFWGTYDEWLESITYSREIVPPASNDYEIYDVVGTCPEYYGPVEGDIQGGWQNTLIHRANTKSLAERFRDSVRTNFDPAEKAVYLTFDDGPDNESTGYTRKVMNSLKSHNVGGTFFFMGSKMNANTRNLVKEIYDNGFPIGLHSVNHTSYLTFDKTQLVNDINSVNATLESITGARSTLVRPPYGDLGEEQIPILTEMGMTVSMWSLDTLDWAHTSAGVDNSVLLQRIKNNVRPGDVLLSHTINAKTPAIVDSLIEWLLGEGYKVKSLPNVNYIAKAQTKNERMQAFEQWDYNINGKLGSVLRSTGDAESINSVDGVNLAASQTPGKNIVTVYVTYSKGGSIGAGSVQFEINAPISVDMQGRIDLIGSAITAENIVPGSKQFAFIGDGSPAFATQIKANTKTSGGIKNITIERQLQGFATPISSAGGSAAYKVKGLLKAAGGSYYDYEYAVVGPVNDERPVATIYGDLLNSTNSSNVKTITQLKWQELPWLANFDALRSEYLDWKATQ